MFCTVCVKLFELFQSKASAGAVDCSTVEYNKTTDRELYRDKTTEDSLNLCTRTVECQWNHTRT